MLLSQAHDKGITLPIATCLIGPPSLWRPNLTHVRQVQALRTVLTWIGEQRATQVREVRVKPENM